MIHEVHGDTCRLGYLKVIACLATDMEMGTPDYIASILLEISLSNLKSFEQSPGLVKSIANAVNYVGLASEMDILNGVGAGETAKIYSFLKSSEPIHKLIKEGTPTDILTLTQVEQIFFLSILLRHDFHMTSGVIKWVLENKSFSRNDAMESLMETVYPEALRQALRSAVGRRREALAKRLEIAERFAEDRRRYSSKMEWVRSRQYAIYRHSLPPRLEWLVDIGILNRVGRGKYSISPAALTMSRDLTLLCEGSREKAEEMLFVYVAKTLLGARQPDRTRMIEALLENYNLVQARLHSVNLDMLKRLTCFSLLEKGYSASPLQLDRAFLNLAIMFPDKVFVKPGKGGTTEITRLEVSPYEI